MDSKIIDLIKKIGFVSNDECFFKEYNGYKISINKDNYLINYGNKIEQGRGTTSNLSHQDETSVVLECVDRLLSIGYLPENIILEKPYPSGRNERGQWLDILVKYNNKSFLMIECKTLDEYNNEIENMEKTGGQLFSYYTADRNPKYLCLYTSYYNEDEQRFDFFSNIIETDKLSGNSKEELFDSWDKTFGDWITLPPKRS